MRRLRFKTVKHLAQSHTGDIMVTLADSGRICFLIPCGVLPPLYEITRVGQWVVPGQQGLKRETQGIKMTEWGDI